MGGDFGIMRNNVEAFSHYKPNHTPLRDCGSAACLTWLEQFRVQCYIGKNNS